MHVRGILKTLTCIFYLLMDRAPQPSHLRLHVKSIHDSKIYACDNWKYKAITASGLHQNLLSIHEQIKYACDTCEIIATTVFSLKQHVLAIHDHLKYACERCNYKATRPSYLCQHVESINGQLEYACERYTCNSHMHILLAHGQILYADGEQRVILIKGQWRIVNILCYF